MSPRAAWRLEHLGYGPVYDYAPGKVDWMAAGLPTVRADGTRRRALDGADRDPPTCHPDELVSEVAGRARGSTFVAVNERHVVLGRYRAGGISADAAARIADVMEPGPATVRAHEPLDELLERMAGRSVHEVVVTTPEGELLGVVRRTEEES
jgi:CBS domain-containing protein